MPPVLWTRKRKEEGITKDWCRQPDRLQHSLDVRMLAIQTLINEVGATKLLQELKGRRMPEICRFLGIIITMYFDEHNPPHFHVRYNEHRASMDINTLNVLSGCIPAKVRGLVEEWAELHKNELLRMWESKEFHKIDPLV